MKVITLTHWDLDGIICSINVYKAISQASRETYQHFICGYYKIDSNIEKIAKIDFDVLFVTDLNLTEEQVIRLGELKDTGNKIIYIDHHVYDYDIENLCDSLGIICIHRMDDSGCLLTHKYLGSPSGMDNINDIGNCYDLWQRDRDEFQLKAMPLNDMFWIMGAWDFFSRFKSGEVKYTKEERGMLQAKSVHRRAYLKEAMESAIINPHANILFIFKPNQEYTNDFTIYYPDFNVYLLLRSIEYYKYTYSLRLSDKNKLTCHDIYSNIKDKFDCLVIAGGHSKTGGLTILGENNTRFLDVFNEVIEEMLDKG